MYNFNNSLSFFLYLIYLTATLTHVGLRTLHTKIPLFKPKSSIYIDESLTIFMESPSTSTEYYSSTSLLLLLFFCHVLTVLLHNIGPNTMYLIPNTLSNPSNPPLESQLSPSTRDECLGHLQAISLECRRDS